MRIFDIEQLGFKYRNKMGWYNYSDASGNFVAVDRTQTYYMFWTGDKLNTSKELNAVFFHSIPQLEYLIALGQIKPTVMNININDTIAVKDLPIQTSVAKDIYTGRIFITDFRAKGSASRVSIKMGNQQKHSNLLPSTDDYFTFKLLDGGKDFFATASRTQIETAYIAPPAK